MASIKLFRGEFGHVSALNTACDLVTHAHREAHIIIWLDGEPGEMTVGDTSVRFGPEAAVGVNSFQPHSHRFPDGSDPGLFLAFYIEPDWMARRQGRPAGAPLFHNPAIPLDTWLLGLAGNLFDRLVTAHDGADLALYETERLIEGLIDGLNAAQAPNRARAAQHLDFRIRKAIALMHASVSGRMTLDEIARHVGLSRPHFFALFKEQMNLTPNVYWNTLRMEEALRQVETSEESLTAVACNLGFTTQGNFTRFFRDHAGVPPTLYREAARTAA